MKLNQKNWGDNLKRQARRETVFDFYRQHFGERLPLGKQYWTLSGQCADANGLVTGCELDDAISSGLIIPSQFHGVEREKDIYNLNRTITAANWHHDDLFNAIRQASIENNFNPGIINYDSLLMQKRGVQYFGRIMAFVDALGIEGVLLVGNFILENPRSGRSQFESLESFSYYISDNRFITKALQHGWEYHPNPYYYNGTGNHLTWMVSVMFYRHAST